MTSNDTDKDTGRKVTSRETSVGGLFGDLAGKSPKPPAAPPSETPAADQLKKAVEAARDSMENAPLRTGQFSTTNQPRQQTPNSDTAFELARRHKQLQGAAIAHRPMNEVQAEAERANEARIAATPDLCIGGSGKASVIYKPLNIKLQFRNMKESRKACNIIKAIIADVAGHEVAEKLTKQGSDSE